MTSQPLPSNGDYITAEGLQALKAELEDLETTGRREIAARIQAARELGDLKENAEYHIAKEDQGHLETKIARLAERVRKARVVQPTTSDVVGFGVTVTVIDEDTGRESTYTIVGSTEADVSAGKLSAESPVAQALTGRRVGEVAVIKTPKGERRFRVERIGS